MWSDAGDRKLVMEQRQIVMIEPHQRVSLTGTSSLRALRVQTQHPLSDCQDQRRIIAAGDA